MEMVMVDCTLVVSSCDKYGDVPVTFDDTSSLERDFEFKPTTSLRTVLHRFAE